MPNESAVTFWLEDRQVNGVLVAESGAEKLAKYGGRFYVVKGKAPEKKHYTQKTLPLPWRKIMGGETPPSPATPAKEGPSLMQAVPQAAAPRQARRQQARKAASPERPAAATSPPDRQQPPAAPEPTMLRTPAAPAPKKKREPGQVAPVAAEQVTKKAAKAPAAGSARGGHQDTVKFSCPYCGQTHELSIAVVKVDKPFFQPCSKCGKDFGVRVVTTIAYRAEVAGFTG